MVLTTPIKRRVTLLKRLIYVAHLCQQANNYNSVFEIVAGLNLGAVARLKRTWKMLPKKYWDVWIRLDKFVSAEGSYRNYRNHLRQLRESNPGCPVVPYLGVNMSDLTFSEDGNPTLMAHDDTLINFGKFQLISRGFDQILELQRNQYPYRVDALLGDYLRRRWEAVDETTLYEYSFACEARHSSLSPT
ncbi:hypothetical protein CXG81DRAFT_8459 [Caulochytrium protostelioides]|uniref:Ras-GEF domain-containing protein n=1 Tax=Caulochytrium protostelioides TaxID=1555241 RepID=A0A4P9XFF4_9FUNG|nr:hypothetical protein CXG81DRAFT_8459 [Caulochytrium protostelioides]|eukprot:RKP04316.1 hypothetical protein CXG81DRAFT_8459 [Caulochytrium protostelioides]